MRQQQSVSDFRSDTVTKPDAKMRQAMAESKVGDDVYGDDPTVNKLQVYAANRFKKEGALFFPSGTQANLCALLSHCQRGDEFICGQESHQYRYEGGGAAALGSIHSQPIENKSDGTIDIQKIIDSIKPDDFHFPVTKLISLENTIHGRAISLNYIKQVRKIVDEYQLLFHLDGARIFNASIALNCDVTEITDYFDSVSICLSKGLGAPAGTILIGNKKFITTATRWRKICGGAMRQVGVLAAAGLIALKDSPKLLLNDHLKAKKLAELISKKKNFNVKVHTNMVFCNFNSSILSTLSKELSNNGIIASIDKTTRFVIHKDISDDSILKLAQILNSVC